MRRGRHHDTDRVDPAEQIPVIGEQFRRRALGLELLGDARRAGAVDVDQGGQAHARQARELLRVIAPKMADTHNGHSQGIAHGAETAPSLLSHIAMRVILPARRSVANARAARTHHSNLLLLGNPLGGSRPACPRLPIQSRKSVSVRVRPPPMAQLNPRFLSKVVTSESPPSR